MGYRIRLGRVSKEIAKKYRNRDLRVISRYYEKRDDAPYRPDYHIQLYEIGKYVSYEEGRVPFYLKFDVAHHYESEFDILTKDGLKKIVESYHKNIKESYQQILDDYDEKKNVLKLIAHIKNIQKEWGSGLFKLKPYYLDEKKTDGAIVSSWKLEYAIFNIVHIYRFFDWEKNYLIYSGW